MKILIPALALLLASSAYARENDPDFVPPPVLEADSSPEPEYVEKKIVVAKEQNLKKKKKGRSLASVETETVVIKKVKVNGDVFRAKAHGKCPAGSHVADFHGWLCAKD